MTDVVEQAEASEINSMVAKMSDGVRSRLTSCFLDDYGMEDFLETLWALHPDTQVLLIESLENKQDKADVLGATRNLTDADDPATAIARKVATDKLYKIALELSS